MIGAGTPLSANSSELTITMPGGTWPAQKVAPGAAWICLALSAKSSHWLVDADRMPSWCLA
ncbi:MAG: hypothetical protein VYA69_04340 [Gemmatimonadota bacterium]|nr:hypothetical protein [Gemmatimonadota bacterium]